MVLLTSYNFANKIKVPLKVSAFAPNGKCYNLKKQWHGAVKRM